MEINEQVLKDLKNMAIITGRLSDVHIKTLEMAPFIFFDDLKEARISYNLVTSHEATELGLGSKFNFVLDFGSKYEKDSIHDKRVQALINTVKHILWNNIEIFIADQDGNNLITKD